jgi:hypothetical protein
MRNMIDAAWPPLGTGVKCDIINRYIGGGTPHVWTQSETDQMMQETGARGILPNFVRVPPTTRDPRAEAAWCVKWMQDHGQPRGTLIALDYETAVSTWQEEFDKIIVDGGYRMVLYGSRSTLFQNKRPSGGYWPAHWNNTPHLCPEAGVAMTQYGGDVTINKPWDISLVADSAPIWGGPMSQWGPAAWDGEDWKAFWSQIPPSKYPETDRALNLAELCGYWPSGGIKEFKNVYKILADLPNVIVAKLPVTNGTLTPDQIKTAVKEALREGTGA